MSTVAPKLYFEKGVQYPVWEVTLPTGQRIYGERPTYPNHVPSGAEYTLHDDGSVFSVIPAVKGHKKIKILTEEDGFTAPMSWYERVKNVVDNDEFGTSSESDSEFIEV